MWINYHSVTYPAMVEQATLRTYSNALYTSVTVLDQDYQGSLINGVWGSTLTPPWTTPFATLGTWGTDWSVTTGGTVGARKIKHWLLKWTNNGGEEGWILQGTSTKADRNRTTRTGWYLSTFEEDLDDNPGGGG